MNNKIIFFAVLFTQCSIASQLKEYPQYKQIMAISNDQVCPLPLVLKTQSSGSLYVRLRIEASTRGDRYSAGSISVRNNNLHVQIPQEYSPELIEEYSGEFFQSNKGIIYGEKTIRFFLESYQKLHKIADGKPICMELIPRVDSAGDGQILKILLENRSFVIEHKQVESILAEMSSAKPTFDGSLFTKAFCGFGPLAIVVAYYFKFVVK